MKSFLKPYKQAEKYYVWIFPAISVLVFLILCIGKIHGSSIGLYEATANPGLKDKNLLFGFPRQIRSDEWVVNSPLQYAQKATNFASINPNIGNGQDMAIVLDMPVGDWSVIFKPQNIAFLFLPFSIAFSFHWWFMLLALLIGAYLLFRTLIPPPKNNLLSALLATAFSFSPFIMWWYTNGTLLSIAYVFWMLFFFIEILKCTNLKYKIAYGVGLAYFVVCLALTFYAPFIIATCLAGLFIAAGYLFSQKNLKKFITKQNILILSLAVFAAAILLGIFYIIHKEAIHLVQSTVYPGRRSNVDSPAELSALFDVFKLFFLQSKEFITRNMINQSEASNFVYMFIYLLVPAAYIIYEGVKHKKNDWFLIIISLGIIVFLTRMLVPADTDFVFKLLLLDKSAKKRLLIGLGVLNISFIIAIIRNVRLRAKPLPRFVIIITTFTTTVMLIAQYFIFINKLEFISSHTKQYIIILSILILSAIVFLLYKRTVIYAALCLLLISMAMSFYINPIYKEVPFEYDTVVKRISQQNAAQSGTWVVLENITLEQYPQMAGANSISGVMIYPQYGVWEDFPNYEQYKDIVNRYAHVTFKLNNEKMDYIYLNQADLMTVNIDPCNAFAQQHIMYFISTKVEVSPCINQINRFYNGQQLIYIYKIIKI
ncbi:MAG: hypothetical protein U0516_00385 [Candidatus Saccharibacteria bacterium]